MERFYLAVARVAKKTLHHMVEHRIPMMPEIYSRHFYRILATSDQSAREIIDEQQEADFKERSGHQSQVLNVMNDLAKIIDNLDQVTSQHNSNLDNHLLNLKETNSHTDLTRLKDEITAELTQIIDNNNQIYTNIVDAQRTVKQLQKKMEQVADMATIDELTGIYNRRALFSRFLEEINRSERYGHIFSILLIDLDDFKKVNDEHGHQIGDAILRGFGSFLRRNLRDSDFPSRFGGEEFICLLPGTNTEQAVIVGNKIRRLLSENSLCSRKAGITLRITVSIGISTYAPNDNMDTLIKRADDALYLAKSQGKNRVVTEYQLESG